MVDSVQNDTEEIGFVLRGSIAGDKPGDTAADTGVIETLKVGGGSGRVARSYTLELLVKNFGLGIPAQDADKVSVKYLGGETKTTLTESPELTMSWRRFTNSALGNSTIFFDSADNSLNFTNKDGTEFPDVDGATEKLGYFLIAIQPKHKFFKIEVKGTNASNLVSFSLRVRPSSFHPFKTTREKI